MDAPITVGSESRRRFGAFDGVFTPTLLTILGVIMYLREGWVVGELGLGGAWLVIAGALAITVSTALSLSSIATNVQLDEGGAYAIMRRSLGIELGGAVGIPQYLAQALAVSMYVFGLRAGWLWIFPDHPPLAVDFAAFAVIFGLAFISADLAFRVQYLVMGAIALSLVSTAAGLFTRDAPLEPVQWWGDSGAGLDGSHFWVVFAVFFPATTGIMAGANMSGELKNPRRSIPLGTLAAVGVAAVVYLVLAYWFARVATPEELRANYRVMIDRAAFGPLVLAGLLGATFSSALSSFVGAPRILHALAASQALPHAEWLAKGEGEPRRAMVVTALIVGVGLMLRDLNAIAPMITLFFLITYATINAVVLLEQRLAVVSFRPRLRLPTVVPLVGTIGSVFAMFVISPTFSLLAVAVVFLGYGLMMRRKLVAEHDDVRSGLFLMLAEWAARHSTLLPRGRSRAWKPNLMVPVVDPDEVLGNFELIVDITKPYGALTLVGIATPGESAALLARVEHLADDFTARGVHCSATVLEGERLDGAMVHAMQTLRSAFLRPNLLFLTPLSTEADPEELERPMRLARDNRMGVLLAALHPKAALGRRRLISVWIRNQSPDWSFAAGLRRSSLNLEVLIPYLVQNRWGGELTLRCAVPAGEREAAETYLGQLLELSRLPEETRIVVHRTDFETAIRETEQVDLNVFGLPDEGELRFVQRMVEVTHTACLFLRDSGEEDALV